MGKNGQQPEVPAQAQVPPGPVPTQFFSQVITANDATRWCLLTALTPVGAATYWLPAGLPGELSAMLAKAENELVSSAGLIVPDVDVNDVLRKMREKP